MTPETHRYGGDASQVGDLWLPEGEPSAIAVLLHGGFWRDRYDRHLMDGLCADLTARGYAAWNVEYRRLGSGGGWPATFEDVAAAIDHLATLGLDLATTIAIGHSAGGHLALWAAARGCLPRDAPGGSPSVSVTHAVAQAGVADLAEAARLRLSNGAAAELLGATPDEWPDRLGLASPAEVLPLGVPQLLVHGGRDDIVPASMSRIYAARARKLGDDVALVELPETGHFEHLDAHSEAWRAVVDWLAG